MKNKIKLYGYRSIGIVIVIYLALLLWIHSNVFKSASETEHDSVNKLNVVQRNTGSSRKVFRSNTLGMNVVQRNTGSSRKVFRSNTLGMNVVQRNTSSGRKVFTSKSLGILPRWNSRSHMSNKTNKTLQVFRQTLSEKEFLTLLEILRAFKLTCEHYNLTYMLYGGSVIGAYRHAGLIPWDDDVDVWMDMQQKDESFRILSKIPGFHLHRVVGKANLWKLTKDITKSNKSQNNSNELFPFIHIIFYIDNSTHIRDSDSVISNRTLFPKSDIFPRKKVVFEDDAYFVPKDMLAVIKRKYGQVNLCTPRTCSNSTVSVPCDRLYRYYPFIVRSHLDNSKVEKLMFDGKVLWEKTV